MDLDKLSKLVEQFAEERQWGEFHNIKNLVMSLSIESAELMEIFQWLTPDQSERISENEQQKERVSEELADIFIYLLKIVNKLDLNLEEICYSKMDKNAKKYPVEKSRGRATKYTDF